METTTAMPMAIIMIART